MNLLDKMLEYHNDPVMFVAEEAPLTDKDITIPILAKHVEEDSDAWFIKHNGQYIMYCAKRSKANPETDGPENLKPILAEAWGRYTKKQLTGYMNYGYNV